VKPSIGLLDGTPVRDLPVEIVERKGLGHPDTVCDALAEQFSIALSRWYLERFGSILHHNVDKALLWGGSARPAFGGGEVLEPIEIYLAGRATRSFRGVEVPVEEIARQAARDWLAASFHALDADRHVCIHCLIRPSSPDLADLFLRRSGTALANDTSFGVGYAPLSPLESAVLAVERALNAPQIRTSHPQIGEDVKVMGLRRGGRADLTVGCALVGRHVAGMGEYLAGKADVRALALAAAGTELEFEAMVNAADGETPDSLYLTVTGTSAEAGDDGQVGRGNRINGLITPYRPMSLEAAAGKNPVSHVGKLYNVVASRLAARLAAEIPEVEEACCYLASRIGSPVDEPRALDIKLRLTHSATLAGVEGRTAEIAQDVLSGVGGLWRELIARPVSC
jgi:S-adenosylmethionine synthetase